MRDPLIAAAWLAIALITALRIAVAAALPLTGDEAYYWEWSRRPAFGYTDHPPMVAWAIALGAPLHWGAFGVRLGCVLCGLGATVATFAAARRLGGDGAGLAAAAALTLAPLCSIAFATASPDGPYVLFWCAALWCTIALWNAPRAELAALLGLFLGGVTLSRAFGWAIALPALAVLLLAESRQRRRAGAIALIVLLIAYAPFVVWNATHGWATIAFSLAGRHVNEGFSPLRAAGFAGTLLAAYGIGTALGASAAVLRSRQALLRWTALPLVGALFALALFERVEIYWACGPFASAAVAAGVAFAALGAPARVRWAAAAVGSAFPLLVFALAAGLSIPATSHALASVAAARLRNSGPFEIFTYAALSHDVARIARERAAMVMTDGYGLSALLDYHDGSAPVVIGYDRQGAQAKSWYDPQARPQHALFVDKEPLATRPDFASRFGAACERVSDGGTLHYRYAGAAARTYYLTWCEGMRAQGLRMLRWERAI